jgi:hypothetical protein
VQANPPMIGRSSYCQYDRFLETDGVTPLELERTISGSTRSLAGGFQKHGRARYWGAPMHLGV